MKTQGLTRRAFAAGAAAWGALPAPRLVAARPTYAQTVLAKRPVAYWRLGEGGGPDAVDGTAHARNGTYHGGVTFERGAVDAQRDSAAVFNGEDAYVEVADSLDFSVATSGNGLTVEAWMRPAKLAFAGETAQQYVHWLGKGEPGRFEWGFRFYSRDSPARPNRISAYIWNADGGEGAGAYFEDALTAESWIHVVATYDAGDRSSAQAGVSIYRDGVLRGNPRKNKPARYAAYDIVPAHGSAPVRFATRDRKSFFGGALDDVAIYPRVLDRGEIAENYRARSGA